jgi:hypothetical protein
MLISTQVPGIQCSLWRLVRANQSQCPCLSYTCNVAFIAARIVKSCQSAHVSAMYIRAGIVRDLVRDHVRAAHVRATLVRANLLSHIIYSLIYKMKDSSDLRFNCGGSEGEVGSTKTPSESNRAGIHLSQPGLSDLLRAHLYEPCLSEPGLSETMAGTMSKLHLSGPHLPGLHWSEPELSETMSECTFIARTIRDYVRATWIRQRLAETISEPHSPQSNGDKCQIVVGVPIWCQRYWSSQEGSILLILNSNQVIFGICTLPLVDEHVSSVPNSCAQCIFRCKRWHSTVL